MKIYENSYLLNLKGSPLNLSLVVFLLLFNFFLVSFTDFGSLNLDFFVIFTFLILIYETNKSEESIKFHNKQIKLTPSIRNIIFFSISVILIAISLSTKEINFPLSENIRGDLIGLERASRLIFSLILMFAFYKTVYIDFGFLVMLFLIGNLLYTLVIKNTLEIAFHIDYLEFLFPGQDIRKEVGNLLNDFNNSQNGQKQTVDLKIMDNLIGFTGILSNFINAGYFIVLIRIIGGKILRLNIHLSKIYLSPLMIWVFAVNGLALWFFFRLYDFTILSTQTPAKLIAEVLLSSMLTFTFMYLIQGGSVFLAYIKEQKFIGQSVFSPPVIVFITLGLGISIVSGSGIAVLLNIMVTFLMMIGITDQWIDYRRKFQSQRY